MSSCPPCVWLANELRAISLRCEGDATSFVRECLVLRAAHGIPSGTPDRAMEVLLPELEHRTGKSEYIEQSLYTGLVDAVGCNPLVALALEFIGCRNARRNPLPFPVRKMFPNADKLACALQAAGVPESVARGACFPANAGNLLDMFRRLEILLVKRRCAPSEDDGRTIFDCIIECLRSIAPSPPRPNKADERRFAARELGLSQKDIMHREKISESTLNKSIRKSREWRAYNGVRPSPKHKRNRTSHTLEGRENERALSPSELAQD